LLRPEIVRYFVTNLYIGRVAAVVIADIVCVCVAALLSWFALSPALQPVQFALATGAVAFASFVVLYYCDAYRLTLMGDARQTNSALLAAAGVCSFGALLVYFWVPLPEGVKPVVAFAGAVYFPLVFCTRSLLRQLYARTAHRVAILGTGDLALAVAAALRERSRMGFDFVGFIAEAPERLPGDYPVLGDMDEFDKILERFAIDEILFAVQDRSLAFPEQKLLRAKLNGVRVESGVSMYERMTGRVYLRNVRPSYLIFADGFRMGRISAAVKRMLDVAVSGLGLLLASPLLLLCVAAIKGEAWLRPRARGPVFYRQARVGQAGRIFEVLKFRSMVQQAETSGPVWAGGRTDPRVTVVGRILRRTRLDEVPQLWNVLVGDMSLVGPRPERPEFVQLLSKEFPYFQLRSTVKPGITGWAQVRHGYVNDVAGAEEKLALDMFYMKHQSVLFDVLILWKTLRTVILLQGV
jgi:exopolysaccharide biosynthesis polyprenyl glycosylphosphotransferase